MPNHEIHCKSCRELYGRDFGNLHKWMDEPVKELGPGHRRKRHNMEKTPKIASKLFGKEAGVAARDHILLDKNWGMDSKIRFPQMSFYL